MRTVPTTEARAILGDLIEEVCRTGESVVITKRGGAKAILSPIPQISKSKYRWGQFSDIKIVGDIVRPRPEDWESDHV